MFPTPENHHLHSNDTFYGAAKAFNEGMLRSFQAMYGLAYTGLRYFNVYGPRMDVHGVYTEVLVRWMERIADGRPPLIFGDGAQTMDFIYTADIARANLLAAVQNAPAGIYNVASGTETSLLELAQALLGGHELGPRRRVRARTRSQRRQQAARGHLRGAQPTWGSGRRFRWPKGSPSWCSGGFRCARRSQPDGGAAKHEPD